MMQTDPLNLEDIGDASVYVVNGRETVSVVAAALDAANWSSAEMQCQVSNDRSLWFAAQLVSGSATSALTADGGIENVYVADVKFARLVTTTAAGASRPIEVRWI